MAKIQVPAHVLETAYAQFADFLLNNSEKTYTAAQVAAGLEPLIYPSLAAVQSAFPTPSAGDSTSAPATEPNWVMVDDGGPELKLAQWDWALGLGGSWALTPFPWVFPFLVSGPTINFPAVTGNIAWAFTMGHTVRVLAAGNITDMYIVAGAGGVGLQHRWEIRRSTVTGAAAPAAATFTIIERTGIHTSAVAEAWESVDLASNGGDIPVTPDQHYCCYHYLGGGGKSYNIATGRTAGQLIEDYALLEQGIYALSGGPNPGSNPLPTPTTVQAGTAYGLNTLEFGP